MDILLSLVRQACTFMDHQKSNAHISFKGALIYLHILSVLSTVVANNPIKILYTYNRSQK